METIPPGTENEARNSQRGAKEPKWWGFLCFVVHSYVRVDFLLVVVPLYVVVLTRSMLSIFHLVQAQHPHSWLRGGNE